MAQQVNVNVMVGGVQITHFTSLRIDQSLHTHHTFEIVVPFETLEDKKDFFFKNAHSTVCGKSVSISFEPYFKDVSADFKFNGIVTELMLHNNSEMVNSFVIKGHSPTFLLEDGGQRRTFIQSTLGQIFGTVLLPYPANMLPKSLNPRTLLRIDYKAQYDESNFDFLSRLAAEYGEWFYYNGTKLIFGKDSAKTESFVVDGVQHFDMSIGLKPNRFSMYHYNYVKHRDFSSAGGPVGGLGPLGTFAYQQASGLFGQSTQMWPLKDINFQSELDDAVELVNATNATDLIRFNGTGENPNLNVGVVVDVTGQKLIRPGEYKKENFGKYRITSISHTVDNIGNYENRFEAVPEAADFPPRNPYAKAPIALPEIATVITNEDPLKLGRVKLQFHWPNQLAGKSSWVRVAFPYTGGSRGMLFIPEKDDQVMISYEANHVDFPVVVGSIYHKSTQNDYWFDNNYQKIIRTKGGNKLVFKDKPGEQEVFITNANKKGVNFHISFKDDGVITLHTDNGLIQLEAKDITLTAKNDIVMKAGNNIEMTADQDLTARAENEMKLSAKTVKINSDGETKIGVGSSLDVQASGKIDIQGSSVDIKG